MRVIRYEAECRGKPYFEFGVDDGNSTDVFLKSERCQRGTVDLILCSGKSLVAAQPD